MGIFAFANETKTEVIEKSENESKKVETLEIICMVVQLSCTEDFFFYDSEYAYSCKSSAKSGHYLVKY